MRIGLLLLLDAAFQGRSLKAIGALGGTTLEMYCIQMLVGGVLVNTLFRLTYIKVLTNILSLAVLIVCSLMLSAARRYIGRVKLS